jgi:PAS domain S-box-containing protein
MDANERHRHKSASPTEDELERKRERIIELETAVAELGAKLESLQQAEKRYRHIVEDQTELVCRFRSGGVITFANPAFHRLTGHAPGTLAGLCFYSFIPSPDRESVERIISSLTIDNPISSLEHRVAQPDGSICWHQWTNRAVFDTQGRFVEYQAVGRDITALKEARETLRRSEEKYRSILDNVTDGIYMIGADGFFTYLNRVSLKRSGLPEDDYTSCHYLARVDLDDRERVRTNFERVMRGEENPPYVLCAKTTDGRSVSLEVKSRPIFEEGQVVSLLGVARDITARKRAEEALRRSEEKYQALLESISDGVFRLDASGRFVYMNRSGLQRTGLTEENLRTSRFIDMVSPDERGKVRTHLRNAIKGDAVPPFELKYFNRKGRTIYVEIRYRPIFEGTKVVGISGISRDITDRKEAEQTILNAKERLEQLVEMRTRELEDQSGQLALRTRNLEEMNTALNVLLKKLENDKQEIENNIRANLQESLLPSLENLKNGNLSERQKACITALEQTVHTIATPFLKNLRLRHANLSPREIQVCGLIKDGQSTKEIATFLNISAKAVEFHRYNIRKKLRLTRKKASLAAYLSRLTDH